MLKAGGQSASLAWRLAHFNSHADWVRMDDQLQDKAVLEVLEENEVLLAQFGRILRAERPSMDQLAFIQDRLAKNNKQLIALERQDKERHSAWASLCALVRDLFKA